MGLFKLLDNYRDRRPEALENLCKFLNAEGKLQINNFKSQVVFLEQLDLLADIIGTSNKILTISISNNNFLNYSGKLAPAFPKIINLNISGTDIGENDISAFAEGLKGNTSIKNLYLPKNQISNDGIDLIAASLFDNCTIVHLDLSANKFNDQGMIQICAAMATMSSLVHANLHTNPLGPRAGKHLAHFIERTASVEKLDLRGTELGDEGIQALAPALAVNKSIVVLDLSANKISGPGLDALAAAMISNKTITSLHLSRNDFGNADLHTLLTSLASNTNVSLLDLNWSGIGTTGASTIARMLPEYSSLTDIDISNNRITQDGITELATAILFSYVSTFSALDNDVDNEFVKQCVSQALNINKACARVFVGNQLKILVKDQLLSKDLKSEEHIYEYLMKSLLEDMPRKQMKLVLLGNVGIGKTTLLNYLPNFQKTFWQQTKDRFFGVASKKPKETVGYDEHKLEIGDSKILAWDFSGKEENIPWLPFFLSKEMAVYLVCYDLSVPEEQQKAQIHKWMDLLRPVVTGSGTQGKIILVGLRSDLKKGKNTPLDTSPWRGLPLHLEVFEISKKDRNSMLNLWNVLVPECKLVLKSTPQIPVTYYNLLQTLQRAKTGIIREDRFHEHGIGPKWKETLEKGLTYLHSVGDIVWINRDLVCTNPETLAKKLATKAISVNDLMTITELQDEAAK